MTSFASAFAPASQTEDVYDVQRKRALAQMLMQQGSQPQGPTESIGGMAVKKSPLEGLSKMLQMYIGGKVQEQADTSQKQIDQAGREDSLRLADAIRGTPAQPAYDLPPDQAGPIAPAQAAKPGNLNEALQIALGSRNPMLQQLGGGILSAQVGSLMPKAPKWEKYEKPNGDGSTTSGFVDINSPNPLSTFTKGGVTPAKVEVSNGNAYNPFATVPGTKFAPQPNLGQDLAVPGPDGSFIPNLPVVNAKKAIAKEGATSVNTYGSPLPIDLGDGRTGYLQPPTRPGGPTQVLGLPGSAKPAMKPLEAGQANRTQDAQDALGLVNMAEKLLDSATGSYAGKAIDTAAGLFGSSTKGAESAQQLKVIQGMLVSKMPKMSGPQSDKDVIQYQQMAGLVGDDTIPIARRKAALKTVRAIQEKYAGSPQGQQQGGAEGGFDGDVIDFGSLKK